ASPRTSLHTPALHDALPISSSTTTTTSCPFPPSSSGGTPISCARKNAVRSSASTRRRPVGVLCPFSSPWSIQFATVAGGTWQTTSEEHTSELQSRFGLVCRL